MYNKKTFAVTIYITSIGVLFASLLLRNVTLLGVAELMNFPSFAYIVYTNYTSSKN